MSFNYCVCLFLGYIANLKIASAQIARRDGLLIEYIANQKFVNSRKTHNSQLLDSRN